MLKGQKRASHNLSRSAEYNVYKIMKQRCYNPNATQYNDYGGRGIVVCQRWLESFDNFLEDMGKRPSSEHTLERKNNNVGYSKQNCFWATQYQQARNKRNTVLLTFNNKTMILQDWATDLFLDSSTIRRRLQKGESFESIHKKFGYDR